MPPVRLDCEHILRAAGTTRLALIFQPTAGQYILHVHSTVLGYFPDVQIFKQRDISTYMNMLQLMYHSLSFVHTDGAVTFQSAMASFKTGSFIRGRNTKFKNISYSILPLVCTIHILHCFTQ